MAIYSGGLANSWILKEGEVSRELSPMPFQEQPFTICQLSSLFQCYHCLSKELPVPGGSRRTHQAKPAEPLQFLLFTHYWVSFGTYFCDYTS